MEDVAKRLQSPMLDGDLKLGHAFGGAGPGAVVFLGCTRHYGFFLEVGGLIPKFGIFFGRFHKWRYPKWLVYNGKYR